MESTYIRMRRIIIKTLLRLLNQWQDNRRIHKRVFITITHKLSSTNTQYVFKTSVLIIKQLTRNQTQGKNKSNKQKNTIYPAQWFIITGSHHTIISAMTSGGLSTVRVSIVSSLQWLFKHQNRNETSTRMMRMIIW